MEIVEKRLRLGADYRSALVYSFPLLSQYFDDVIAKIERQPIDSEVTFCRTSSRCLFSATRKTA